MESCLFVEAIGVGIAPPGGGDTFTVEGFGMTPKRLHLKCPLALLALATFFWLGTPANAQTVPGQKSGSVQDNDTTRQQLVTFDQFLDSHPKLGEQIHKDPSLVNNDEFVRNHPALQNYLADHPGVREEITANPNAFMKWEALHERHVDNIARDRDQDPARARDPDFNRDRDTTRRELANFDQFLDKHREIAEQIRKNPSLMNNDEFVKNHPALQTYLKDHPEVREEVKENPNAFMQQEARYDRREDNRNFDRDRDRDRDSLHRQFGEFLGGHSNVAQQLSKDPSLVKNQEFMENHPDLKEFLSSHPDVQQQLMRNPESFVNSSQKFSSGTNNGGTVKSPCPTAAPAVEPKPKQ
jgi:hypothetical protein